MVSVVWKVMILLLTYHQKARSSLILCHNTHVSLRRHFIISHQGSCSWRSRSQCQERNMATGTTPSTADLKSGPRAGVCDNPESS